MYSDTDDAALDLRRGDSTIVGPWMATRRFKLRPAAGGLALVQDFLNTGAQAQRCPDLLADVAHAKKWSKWAARAWSAERGVDAHAPVLTDHDVAALRDLRGLICTLLSREFPCSVSDLGSTALTLSPDGQLQWQPSGQGWRWWSAAICNEVVLSQHCATWQRMKQCSNPACRAVFYDSAWNNSDVWHAWTCADTSPPVSGRNHCG